MPCFSQVAAISRLANSAVSRPATIQPTTLRLKMSYRESLGELDGLAQERDVSSRTARCLNTIAFVKQARPHQVWNVSQAGLT